jgi:hypothetical protein
LVLETSIALMLMTSSPTKRAAPMSSSATLPTALEVIAPVLSTSDES